MKNRNYPLYDVETFNNLKELVNYTSAQFGDEPAFTYERKKVKASTSYRQFRSDIEALGTCMFGEGSGRRTVAVIGENSYEWILTYFAVVNSGNIIVPLDKELPVAEIKNLLDDSGAEILVHSDDYSDVAEKLRATGADISRYINMDSLQEMIARGLTAIEGGATAIVEYVIDDHELAALLYTSGTTGKPKGVMLSHFNLASDAASAGRNIDVSSNNMLVLPIHHSFGFTAAVCAPMLKCSETCINSSLKNVLSDMVKYKPGFMFLVPLFVETFYKKIWDTAKKQGKDGLLKRMIGLSNALLKVGIDLRRVFFKSVLDSFGGNLNMAISGGAPLDDRYVKGFRSLGVNLLNGYGITECAPVVSVNRNFFYRDGSIGQVLDRCKVKIADPDESGHGEICVSGDIVMLGYYKNEQATNDAFDGEWFKTGDIGYLDRDGFLFISGRKKNLIILNNGKNVYPEEIESVLLGIEYIKEALVYAEDNAIVAEVFPDTENFPDCASRLDGDIIALNKALPIYKNIGKTKIREVEFPKTTTKKIIRDYGEGVSHD